ncbi:MAG: DUF1015 domain-containing protein [Solirubrobacteraceae bacterium]
MAEVRPLRALRYEPAVCGPLERLVSPPYDVIDFAQRAALAAGAEHNVVHIDLPEDEGSADPYASAAELLRRWRAEGAVVRAQQPGLWALSQDFLGPDGVRRTRRGVLARVRVQQYGPGQVRPHERTHPGPKEDRLRLTRATRANLSPIFALHSDPAGAAWSSLQDHLTEPPFGDITDCDGTRHRLWSVSSPAAIDGYVAALAEAELLIADGHHRYETARVYAEEIGGEGAHRYVLCCLVALEDPGLAVFPTHRLLDELDDGAHARVYATLERDFIVEETTIDALVPSAASVGEPVRIGFLDGTDGRPRTLTLREQSTADRALEGYSEPYRRLDTALLEVLVLRRALGLSEDDISHKHGLDYARDFEEAISAVGDGRAGSAFFMAPPPVEQVRAIAAAGESMPPKSTYFFPKILTGLLFNPLDEE